MKPLATANALPTNGKRFYSHGKLLLTAEYLVLDGAEAMAIPCRFGQDLCIEDHENNTIDWKAYTNEKTLWGNFSFPIAALKHPVYAQPKNEKDFLIKLLQTAKKLNLGLVHRQRLGASRSREGCSRRREQQDRSRGAG